MQVQVSTDNHIRGSEELTREVESVVEGALSRFGQRITRVEVHLTDESGSKKDRENDNRCVMEARVAGLQPITVSSQAGSVEQAFSSAADKLEQMLDRTLGRLDDHGRTLIGGEPTL